MKFLFLTTFLFLLGIQNKVFSNSQNDTIVYFGNSHLHWIKTIRFQQQKCLGKDTIIITKDSLFIKSKEVNHYDKNALEKKIAIKDLLHIQKKNLTPLFGKSDAMFLFILSGLSYELAYLSFAPFLMGSLSLLSALEIYPAIRHNRIIEIQLPNHENLFLYSGFKTRKIYRKLKERMVLHSQSLTTL